MKRKDFIKKSLAAGAGASVIPSVFKNIKPKKSTYDKALEQVGFNHLPNKNEETVNTVLHKANTRGSADHGWLKVNHTFSFANYHNPDRMNFGVLRVLNDDQIAGSKGFGMHPHDNMEIITIPLEGDLAHKDNMGNAATIKSGDIQVMSAGLGVLHSEINPNKNEHVKLLQIWLFPNKQNVEPRYEQVAISELEKENEFYKVLSPDKDKDGVWIHQDAYFSLGNFEKGKTATYTLNKKKNGVYAFVIEGDVTINEQSLNKRDGYGIWDIESFEFKADADARVLLMEVPMTL